MKNVYIYKSLKLNERLRLNQYEKPFSPFFFFRTENFVINREQNLFSRNHLLYFRYVIKELVHAFSCAYIELWINKKNLSMYKINKLHHGKRFVRELVLYQKSHSFAALTRSISDTSPTRVKIPHARAFHEVISKPYKKGK